LSAGKIARRDANAARRFFPPALRTLKVKPTEMVTDAAATYPAVLDEIVPQAWHHVEPYANNPVEADHSQLKQPHPHYGSPQRSPNSPTRADPG
jgi:transposase-like protein